MEAALQVILGLFQLGRIQRQHSGMAPLVPQANLAALVLSTLAPAPLSAELVRELDEWIVSAAPTAQTIVALRQMAERLAQANTGEQQRGDQLERAAHDLQLIAVINQDSLAGQPALQQLELELAQSPLLAYLQEWYLQATSPAPDTIIVSMSASQPGEHGVRLRGQHFIERRVTLHYSLAAPFPQIGVQALAATTADSAPAERPLWPQRPSPDDDLAIYTEQERYKGRVASRRVALPLAVAGHGIRLILAAPTAQDVIATSLFDEHDRELARVMRWPPLHPSSIV